MKSHPISQYLPDQLKTSAASDQCLFEASLLQARDSLSLAQESIGNEYVLHSSFKSLRSDQVSLNYNDI